MTTVWPEWDPPQQKRRADLRRYLLISLALHVSIIVSIEFVRYLQLNHPLLLPLWLQPPPALEEMVVEESSYQLAADEVEIPVTFIEVDPTLVTPQEPETARYYSTASTQAANPDAPRDDADVPFIDGIRENTDRTFSVAQPTLEQPEVASVEQPEMDVPLTPLMDSTMLQEMRPELMTLTDATPVEAPKAIPMEALQPQGETFESDVEPVEVAEATEAVEAVTATETEARPEADQPERERLLADARPIRPFKSMREARDAKGILMGEKMFQEGGVKRHQLQSSLDVKSSPYADYDRQFIYAVQQHWYHLLSRQRYALDRTGKVVVRFKLRSNGTIGDMSIAHSDVGDIWSFICESAILSPSPYAKWPSEMRQLVGADYREVTFTFQYF